MGGGVSGAEGAPGADFARVHGGFHSASLPLLVLSVLELFLPDEEARIASGEARPDGEPLESKRLESLETKFGDRPVAASAERNRFKSGELIGDASRLENKRLESLETMFGDRLFAASKDFVRFTSGELGGDA